MTESEMPAQKPRYLTAEQYLERRPASDDDLIEFREREDSNRRTELNQRIKREFRSETELHAFGYRSNHSRFERQRTLGAFVRQHGLRLAAETIAANTRFAKAQKGTRMANAITNWESDLLFLKVTYRGTPLDDFDGSGWPTTEPY